MNKTTKPRKKVAIIGGGYVGALSAILFSQNEELEVILIEKQNRLGGLYNNAWEFGGYSFDYGARAIVQTGIKEIDDTLDQILPDNSYNKSKENLKEFSFQVGKLREYSNCLDVRLLEPYERERGIRELLSLKSLSKEFKKFENLETFSKCNYGKTLTRLMIKPVIEKLTGINIRDTSPGGLAAHNLQRLIIADQDMSRSLKTVNKFNDDRIAYSVFNDHQSDVQKSYPKTGGLKDFGDRLLWYLNNKNNVRVLLENSVVNMEGTGFNLQSLCLEDGSVVNVEEVIWSIPLVFLAKLLDINTIDLNFNEFRHLILSHYLIQGSVNTKGFYIYNYEPHFLNYRTSFYENYSNCSNEFSPMTIESFSDNTNIDLESIKIKLFNESKEMGIISKDSKIIEAKIHLQQKAVPNQSVEFFKNQQELFNRLDSKFFNLRLLGGTSGSKSLLLEAYKIFQHI